MKRLIMIGNTVFPYFYLALFILMFSYGRGIGFVDNIWENYFKGTIMAPVAILLFVIIVMYILNLIYMIFALNSKKQRNLVKSNMLVKLFQIPAYALIFVLGFLCIFTIFTMGISMVLFLLDALSVGMTGLFAIAAYSSLEKNNIITKKEKRVYSFLSFIFCADVVVAVIAYIKEKKYYFTNKM